MSRTITDFHATFSCVTHSFKSKNDAAEVAGVIRRMMDRRFEAFNPLSVSVEGKRDSFTIEFPRLKEFWSPRDITVRGIAEEVTRIANEYSSILERK